MPNSTADKLGFHRLVHKDLLIVTVHDDPVRLLKNFDKVRLQGHSTAEIAGEVGLHPIATRVRLSRLRERLQAAGILNEWI